MQVRRWSLMNLESQIFRKKCNSQSNCVFWMFLFQNQYCFKERQKTCFIVTEQKKPALFKIRILQRKLLETQFWIVRAALYQSLSKWGQFKVRMRGQNLKVTWHIHIRKPGQVWDPWLQLWISTWLLQQQQLCAERWVMGLASAVQWRSVQSEQCLMGRQRTNAWKRRSLQPAVYTLSCFVRTC